MADVLTVVAWRDRVAMVDRAPEACYAGWRTVWWEGRISEYGGDREDDGVEGMEKYYFSGLSIMRAYSLLRVVERKLTGTLMVLIRVDI